MGQQNYVFGCCIQKTDMKLDWLFPYVACCQFFLVLYFAFKLPGSFSTSRRSVQPSGDVMKSNQANTGATSIRTWTEEDGWIFRNYISVDESKLSYWTSSALLPRALTVQQYAQYIKLVARLSEALIEADVTFLMGDRTLLGAFMMHDILPWDDKVDFMARLADRPKIETLTSSVSRDGDIGFQVLSYDDRAIDESEGGRGLHSCTVSPSSIQANGPPNSTVRSYHKFKFFQQSGAEGNTDHEWPFVDLTLYCENDSYVWHVDGSAKRRTIKKEDFYPLHMRPLAGLWLPAPADTRTYLRKVYGRFRCRTSTWSHRLGQQQRQRRGKCRKIARSYPVVWREPAEGGTVREILRYRDKVVRVEEVSETFVRSTLPLTL